jgi:L-cysteine/cystine lyase
MLGIIRAVIPPFPVDDERLRAFRDALPAVTAGVYLNAGTAGPLPSEVAAAMAELAEWELRTGRAHPAFFELVMQRRDEARAGLATVLTADVDDVALTTSTSHGMSLASWAVQAGPGDRIVTTTLEHAGALGPAYALRDRGVEAVFADVGDGADDGRTLSALADAIDARTRVVSVSHVAWSTGAVLPVARIAELAHERGALLVVDGAQAAGAMPLDVPSLGADFYAVPGQKWLLGPEGAAGLWVSPGLRTDRLPAFGGWSTFERLDARGLAEPWSGARRYDAPNWYKPGLAGLARSLGWLAMYVGWEWIHGRALALARGVADRLAAIPGVELLTPRTRMATLVSFRVAGWTAQAVMDELGARGFVVCRTIPALDAVRFSVGAWNSTDELERTLSVVELIASHTPEDIPPRRDLEIVDLRRP